MMILIVMTLLKNPSLI